MARASGHQGPQWGRTLGEGTQSCQGGGLPEAGVGGGAGQTTRGRAEGNSKGNSMCKSSEVGACRGMVGKTKAQGLSTDLQAPTRAPGKARPHRHPASLQL